MSDTQKNKSTSQISNVSPHLVCDGAAEAIDFYKQAFDATEMMRLAAPNGKLVHGCVSICGSSVMLVDENKDFGMLGPKALGGTPVTIHLMVDDVDALHRPGREGGSQSRDARGRHVLGRSLRDGRRPVRPSLVHRHPPTRHDPRGDRSGDARRPCRISVASKGRRIDDSRLIGDIRRQ